MKITILSTLLFCLHFSLFSQTEISLAKHTFLPKVPYKVMQIVDARAEKRDIGMIQKGMLNKVKRAFFAHPFEEELLSLFKHQASREEYNIPLVLRFNALNIYEFTYGMKEIAFLEIHMDFILEENGKHYLLFETGGIYEKSGLDATGFHAANISMPTKS